MLPHFILLHYSIATQLNDPLDMALTLGMHCHICSSYNKLSKLMSISYSQLNTRKPFYKSFSILMRRHGLINYLCCDYVRCYAIAIFKWRILHHLIAQPSHRRNTSAICYIKTESLAIFHWLTATGCWPSDNNHLYERLILLCLLYLFLLSSLFKRTFSIFVSLDLERLMNLASNSLAFFLDKSFNACSMLLLFTNTRIKINAQKQYKNVLVPIV